MEKNLHFLSISDHFQMIKKTCKKQVLNNLALGGGARGGYQGFSASTTKIKTFLCMSSLIQPFVSGDRNSYCICTYVMYLDMIIMWKEVKGVKEWGGDGDALGVIDF